MFDVTPAIVVSEYICEPYKIINLQEAKNCVMKGSALLHTFSFLGLLSSSLFSFCFPGSLPAFAGGRKSLYVMIIES
jgi:hypothetical protein